MNIFDDLEKSLNENGEMMKQKLNESIGFNHPKEYIYISVGPDKKPNLSIQGKQRKSVWNNIVGLMEFKDKKQAMRAGWRLSRAERV